MKLKDMKKEYMRPEMRLVKAKAKELMFAGENHLTLIFSLLLITASAVVPLFVFSLIYEFYPYFVTDVAMLLMELLVVPPMLFGLVSMANKMAEGERCVLTDLFVGFSDFKTYRRSLFSFVAFLVILVIFACPIAVPFVVAHLMRSASVGEGLILAEMIVGVVITSPLSIWLFCRMSIAPILNVKGEGVFRSTKRSFILTRKKGIKLVCFALRFIPLLFVSIVAVFVPMLIYTAPYLLCVWAVGAKMICENNE